MTSTLGLGRGKEKERRRRHDCDGERWGYIPGKVGLVSAEGMKRVVRKLKTIFVPRPRLPWKFNQGCSLHLILSFFLSFSLSLSLSVSTHFPPRTQIHMQIHICFLEYISPLHDACLMLRRVITMCLPLLDHLSSDVRRTFSASIHAIPIGVPLPAGSMAAYLQVYECVRHGGVERGKKESLRIGYYKSQPQNCYAH